MISRKDKKIPTKNAKSLSVEFAPTPKIVDAVKTFQKDIFLVLFKAEHDVTDEELITRAHRRLQSANADLIIANDVNRPGVGFGTETNELFVVNPSKKVVKIAKTSKSKAAHQVLDAISKYVL